MASQFRDQCLPTSQIELSGDPCAQQAAKRIGTVILDRQIDQFGTIFRKSAAFEMRVVQRRVRLNPPLTSRSCQPEFSIDRWLVGTK